MDKVAGAVKAMPAGQMSMAASGDQPLGSRPCSACSATGLILIRVSALTAPGGRVSWTVEAVDVPAAMTQPSGLREYSLAGCGARRASKTVAENPDSTSTERSLRQ
jgi:hypothetical protein